MSFDLSLSAIFSFIWYQSGLMEQDRYTHPWFVVLSLTDGFQKCSRKLNFRNMRILQE